MSNDLELAPPLANPRPGVVTALGILNVVIAVVILTGLMIEVFWLYAMFLTAPSFAEPGPAPSADPTGPAMFGMNDARFLRFTTIDAATGLVLNLMMLASGIGLLNLRRWGARLWAWTAGLKLARLLSLWGFFYIVLVTPSLSANMARSLLATMNPRLGTRGAPSLGELTRVYAILNLIMAVLMMVFGSIYPVLSLWFLGRPGARAALERATRKEPDLR